MASQKFDQIDLQILGELQKNGRMTNVELAQMVGLTAPPCLRRVRALEESGVIRSYHADLDAAKLGYGITVFAMVSLRSQAESDLKAFEDFDIGYSAAIALVLAGVVGIISWINVRYFQDGGLNSYG